MPIYNGSQKLKDIYIGGTKIKEIYNGSTLVYKSGYSIPMYGYTYKQGSKSANIYMIGGMTNSHYAAYVGSATASTATDTIFGITGNIGDSGSKITVSKNAVGTYNRTILVNGISLCCYLYKVNIGGLIINYEAGVLDDAVVGSKVLFTLDSFINPNSANSSQVNYGGYIYTRNSSLDFIFTGE